MQLIALLIATILVDLFCLLNRILNGLCVAFFHDIYEMGELFNGCKGQGTSSHHQDAFSLLLRGRRYIICHQQQQLKTAAL